MLFGRPKLTEAQMVDNNLRGQALEKAGREDEAIRLYEQNVAAGFDGSHPYNRLAILYRKRGDIENERRVLKAAMDTFKQRDPKRAKFKERLQKLNVK